LADWSIGEMSSELINLQHDVKSATRAIDTDTSCEIERRKELSLSVKVKTDGVAPANDCERPLPAYEACVAFMSNRDVISARTRYGFTKNPVLHGILDTRGFRYSNVFLHAILRGSFMLLATNARCSQAVS
jgi:hypothetical protein